MQWFKFVNLGDEFKQNVNMTVIFVEETLNVTIPENVKDDLRSTETVTLADYVKIA
jgi:hypothetical protein